MVFMYMYCAFLVLTSSVQKACCEAAIWLHCSVPCSIRNWAQGCSGSSTRVPGERDAFDASRLNSLLRLSRFLLMLAPPPSSVLPSCLLVSSSVLLTSVSVPFAFSSTTDHCAC